MMASSDLEARFDPFGLGLGWPHGDSVRYRLEFVDELGDPVSQLGYTFEADYQRAYGHTKYAFAVDAADAATGVILLTAPVDPLMPLVGVWDLRRVGGSGAVSTVLAGDVHLTETVSTVPTPGVAVADQTFVITIGPDQSISAAFGAVGPQGPAGPAGEGVPAGGTAGQVLEKIDGTDYNTQWADLVGGGGADGLSAYEVAVAEGFVGTEAAWLASLIGPQGVQGVQGDPGPAGADGPQGPAGADGAQGIQGPQGDTGPAGADGADGTGVAIQGSDTYANIIALPSPSAGDMWIQTDTAGGGVPGDGLVYNGAAWTNVGPIRGPEGPAGVQGDTGPQGVQGVQGDPGPAGADGADGAPGAAGADGADGLSAYEVAVAEGFVGTEAAWLASLIGADGPQGVQGVQGDTGPQGDQGIQGIQGDPGATGDTGPAGADGQGVPVGGTVGQVLEKIDGTDFNTQWADAAAGGAALSVAGVPDTRTAGADDGLSPWIMFRISTNTAQTMDWGTVRLALAYVVGGYTPDTMTLRFNAASDGPTEINAVIYNMAADGLPGTLAASWTFTGDAGGKETLTGQTQAIPDSGWYWVGAHAIQQATETKPTFDQSVPATVLGASALDERYAGIVVASQTTLAADLTAATISYSRYAYVPMITGQVTV